MRLSRDPLTNPVPLIRRVYSYVAYRIGDGVDAEDVTSDVFERAIRYRESYDERAGGKLVCMADWDCPALDRLVPRDAFTRFP